MFDVSTLERSVEERQRRQSHCCCCFTNTSYYHDTCIPVPKQNLSIKCQNFDKMYGINDRVCYSVEIWQMNLTCCCGEKNITYTLLQAQLPPSIFVYAVPMFFLDMQWKTYVGMITILSRYSMALKKHHRLFHAGNSVNPTGFPRGESGR